MRSLFVAVALALLCSFATAQEDLPEFVPCSLNVLFHSTVLNRQGEVVASSVDRVIRDNEHDIWRWDSDFTGLPGVLDPQKWIIVWRPDLNASYLDLGEKCVKGDGGHLNMLPLPYDWLLEKTYGITWFRNIGNYEGLPCYIYHAKFFVVDVETTMTTDIYVLQNDGSLLLINGTAQSDKFGLDLIYAMEVQYYDQHQEVRPTYFIPAAHCTDGVPVPAPPASSDAFVKSCYGEDSSMGVRAVASWVAVVLLLVSVLFF